MTTVLDTDWVRAQFPALATPWALFENAGGSVPARHVVERVADYMSTCAVQLGAGYPLSREASERVDAGRRAAARLLNADEDEVVLGPSSTVLAKLLARALRPGWREGDEVIVTDVDHETNSGPWRALAETGLVVREWRLDPDSLRLEPEALDALLTERTRLVAFTHCSNVVGTIHDARSLCARVRAAGALACVDGVAYGPHRRIDVRAIGADFYLASLYKIYGPHVAMLYGRRELLRGLANQNHFFHVEPPATLEPGGVVHELVSALPGVTAYLEDLAAHHADAAELPHGADGADPLARAFELVARHEARLVAPLLEFLASRPGVRLIGGAGADPEHRAPTVSFVVDGVDAGAIPPRLEERRLAVRSGDFYAARLIRSLGLADRGGVVRASLVHYNTEDEVARLIEGLEAVV